MKKKISIVLFIFFSVLMNAQEKINAQEDKKTEKGNTITINMKSTPSINVEAVRNIKKGDFFSLKIKNLNTFLYSVKLEGQDIKIEPVNLPENLLSLISFEGLASAIADLNFISDASIPDISFQYKLQSEHIINELEKSNRNPVEIIDDIIGSYKNKLQKLDSLNSELNNIYIDVIDHKSSYYYIKKSDKVGDFSASETEEIKIKFKKIRNTLRNEIIKISNLNANFEAFITVYSEEIKEKKELTLEVEKLKNVKAEIIKVQSFIQDGLSAEKYDALNKTFAIISNHKAFSFKSLPMQLIEDEKELKLEIYPKHKDSDLLSYTTTIKFPDQNPNFWGVSSGIYIAKNLNENYSMTQRDTTVIVPPLNPDDELERREESKYTLIEEKRPEEEVGINVMVFKGYSLKERLCQKDIFFTVGLGAGLSISEKPKPRLFLSPGLAIGNKNKFTINAGGIYMFYDVLSNGYETNIEYDNKPTDFLVTDTQIRGFISLGYVINI